MTSQGLSLRELLEDLIAMESTSSVSYDALDKILRIGSHQCGAWSSLAQEVMITDDSSMETPSTPSATPHLTREFMQHLQQTLQRNSIIDRLYEFLTLDEQSNSQRQLDESRSIVIHDMKNVIQSLAKLVSDQR